MYICEPNVCQSTTETITWKKKNDYNIKLFWFVCLCWGFTAQSTLSAHIKRSQFTLQHFYWADLVP